MPSRTLRCFCALSVSFLISVAHAPVADAADDYAIVLLPDTQYYSKTYPATYLSQTNWIAAHRDVYDIRFVVHLGDITHNNTTSQWQNAKAAHTVLDNAGIPYSMVPGNHDNPLYGYERDTTLYNSYFGPDAFAGESWYGGHYGVTNDNNYTFFSFDDLDFMVVSLEFAPRSEVLTWANDVIYAHPYHRVIIATHCYQDNGGDHRTDCACDYDLTGAAGNDLFGELVQRHSNIFMVVSGHVSDSELRERTGLAGNTIYEVLTDYQSEPGGGNGWLRLVRFYPDEDRISFQSVSTLGETDFYYSAYDADPAHPDHYFSVDYDMSTLQPYSYHAPLSDFVDRTVNSVSSGQQLNPAIAVNNVGDMVVVWADDLDENGYYQIKARGFDAVGDERFSDITVNSVASGQQLNPDVAIDAFGNFYVVWEDDQDNDGNYQIMLRGFNADGTERFSDRQVNVNSGGQHVLPSIACDNDGDVAVTLQDDSDGNGWYQIHVRGYDTFGSESFSLRTVNSVSSGQQLNPDIGMDSNGNFVVAWEDDKDKNGWYQIMARGFHAEGSQRFGDMTVNSVGSGQQYAPAVAVDYSGNFVVAWEDDQDGNDYYQILARGFYAGGTERIGDFTVNSEDDGQQYLPSIGMNDDGDFVIAWQDDQDGNGYYQILARGFYADGDEAVHDLTVNTCGAGQQNYPAIDLSEVGIFVSAWQDDKDENGYYEILMNGIVF